MSIHRFFVPHDCIHADEVLLPEGVQNQIVRVLRLQAGDQIIVLDGRGFEYRLNLVMEAGGKFTGKILSEEKNTAEPYVKLNLFIAMTQREKMEWILQKGTEVGVAGFQPFTCRRSLVQNGGDFDRKRSRLEKILQEAAEQCGRGLVPQLHHPLALDKAIENAIEKNFLSLAAWEGERQTNLKELLAGFSKDRGSIALVVGPEGGFEQQEIEHMRARGVRTFSLGRRILRMETAAILAPALVLYQLGEISV